MDQNTRSISIHLTINKETSLYHFRYRDFYFHEFSPDVDISAYYVNQGGGVVCIWGIDGSYGDNAYTKKEFSFRSPSTWDNGGLCIVNTGNIYYAIGVDGSYGRSSPDISYEYNSAYYTHPIGDVVDITWYIGTDSCGINFTPRKSPPFALRTSTTAAMRVVCVRMVSSTLTTAFGVSRIPTGLTISFVYHLYEKYNPVFRQFHLYYGGTYYD